MKLTKTQLVEIIKEEYDEIQKEAGRPHSMRGGRTMADLDKDAKTRETDFLKKGEEEEEEEEDDDSPSLYDYHYTESKTKISRDRLMEIIKEEHDAVVSEAEPGVHDIMNLPDPEAVEPSGNPKEDALRQIVAQSQAAKVDGVMVDSFTASAIVQILDALKPEIKEKYLQEPIQRMASMAMRMAK